MVHADADLILAIDQGTTGSTALLVDRDLEILGRVNHEFPQHFPRPGWVEHDPEELWGSVIRAIGDVLEQTGVPSSRIAALGITNQRETSLVWDRATGKPLHRALVWQDRRTADTCAALKQAGHEDRVRELTGLVLDPYFSATKIAWVLDHVTGARETAEGGALAAGTIDTYLVWRLTGGANHVTEPSNASRTLLWPLAGGGWSEEQCERMRVPMSLLPEVRPCTARFGETRGVPGLPDGIPIHGIAGDQQAALFGQACFNPGEAKCTYGTGAFVMLNTGEAPVPSRHGLLTTVGWQLGDRTTYCLEGSAFMAGAVVQWLRDGLGFFTSAREIEPLAASVEDSGGVVFVPGHAGLGAPHWRPDARGLITGLTRGTTRAHIAEGGPRRDRPADHRSPARDGRRSRAPAHAAPRRRRRRGQQSPYAAPGRSPRRPAGATDGARDDRDGRSVPRRPRGRAVGRYERAPRRVATRSHV